MLTGDAAASRARLRRSTSYNRFWRELSTLSSCRAPMPGREPPPISPLRISTACWRRFAPERRSCCSRCPPATRASSSGCCSASPANAACQVAGIVDAAVAAVALEPAGARVLHLDLELHYAVLTALEPRLGTATQSQRAPAAARAAGAAGGVDRDDRRDVRAAHAFRSVASRRPTSRTCGTACPAGWPSWSARSESTSSSPTSGPRTRWS